MVCEDDRRHGEPRKGDAEVRCSFRSAWPIGLAALALGCDVSTRKNEQPDPIYIGEFIGDRIQPEIFGDGVVKCSGKNLVSQGFSGGMDRHSSIEFLGKIAVNDIIYYVYFFGHVANHAVYRILIFEYPCKYVGSYSVEDRPISVSAQDIIFNVPKDSGNLIHFSGETPPARIFVDGRISDLSK